MSSAPSAEIELALRRQRLQLRSAALREALAGQAVVLEAPLAVADRVRDAGRWVVRERGWLLAGVVVVVIVRPRRAWRVLRFGWWLWRAARVARPWLVAAGLVKPPRAAPRPG